MSMCYIELNDTSRIVTVPDTYKTIVYIIIFESMLVHLSVAHGSSSHDSRSVFHGRFNVSKLSVLTDTMRIWEIQFNSTTHSLQEYQSRG